MRLEFARIHYSADTRLSASSSHQPTGEPGYEAKISPCPNKGKYKNSLKELEDQTFVEKEQETGKITF